MSTRIVPEKRVPETRPSQIRCRYCGDVLTLNPDGEQARASGTDPYQQMRKHILHKHAMEVIKHTRHVAWLIDMMFFEAVNDRQAWRQQIAKMVDCLLVEEP